MNRKTKVDKSLFDFAFNINSLNDLTINNLEKVYKIDSDVCKSKANKNCVNNVKCINGLGEKSWLTQTDEYTCDEMSDTKLGRRLPSSFVGIKNLGATCYVNCLLQVWFHNPVLRYAIYNWRPEEDPDESEFNSSKNSSLNVCDLSDNQINIPISCVGKLQYVFGLMQFGIRCSVDPTPIIKCLELDENKQQDAHEFSNLFFTFIERKLKFQNKASVQQTIQNQYVGKFAYFTRCQVCEDGSERESQFYELALNIKGCKDIYESLFEYLKVEKLEGNNQYYCGNCKSKQNAERFIELRKLPPILNLQLLRFVFDPQKDSLKKLNSFIRFPDSLDIKPYLNSDNLTPEETTYNLSAVLIHRGPSAHSGHYIAHIKDRNTDFWYKFNDEKVEKIEGKKLKLDSDDGIEEIIIGNGDHSPKAEKQKDWHNSNNAYMLVYTNQKQQHLNLSDDYKDWNLPQYLINAIEKDNKEFEESVAEQQKQKDLEIKECIKHRTQVRGIYENLVALPDKPYEFISKKWLTDWLSARSSQCIKQVDNNDLLCIHSNLNFKTLSSFKCISKDGADQIYELYGGGPRLNRDSLCSECVLKQVNVLKTESNLDSDSKFIASHLKYTLEPNEESFWIGKDSLKSWKQIKLKSYENNCSNQNGNSSNESKNRFESESFNDEVLCEHGELTPDEDNRKLVPVTVWRALKKHFPEAPEVPKNARVCQKCVLINEELETVKTHNKEIALKQKTSLPDLSTERKRLSWDELSVQGKYFALNRKFLIEWKRFINDPTKRDPPERIKNDGLLCAHQLFLYPPKLTEIIGSESKFVVITKEEWETLISFYSFDYQIYFHVVVDENNSNSIDSTPTYCNSCHKSLVLEEERERLTYNNQTIYVRKTETHESLSDSSSEKKEEKSDSYQTISKKVKKEDKKLVYGNHDNQGLRRSSRRRKNKNEKEIKVSSDDTLLALKIKIMNHFNVAPFDQHLSIDDRQLLNNEKTLAQLRVEPFTIITLKVDEEPSGDSTLIEDDYIKGSAPEMGFKGTQLQNH